MRTLDTLIVSPLRNQAQEAMTNRPIFPVEIRAEIEQAREAIFSDKKRFNLIFLPVFEMRLIQAISDSRTSAPVQRMPATMELQVRDLTAMLFHAEAKHYRELAPDADTLRVWLTEYRAGVTHEVKKLISDERQNFHLSAENRIAVIDRTLDSEIEQIIKAKAAVAAKSSLLSTGQRKELLPQSNLSSVKRLGSIELSVPSSSPQIRSHKRRLSASITSPAAVRRVEQYLNSHTITLTDFASLVPTTDRTIRRFRATGKIRRDLFDGIAKAMGITAEELIKP
jgi:hypothetical protein